MQGPSGSRMLLAVCAAMALLLAALATVQYRWSTRVAAADAQREREHLDSAATLFATEFNAEATKTAEFLQNDAQTAVKKGTPISSLPKLIGELYYIDATAPAGPLAKRLAPDGSFADVAIPDWHPNCSAIVTDRPPAMITPLYETSTVEKHGTSSIRILRSVSNERCLVARLDHRYLRDDLFPRLIRQSFGGTSSSDYDFAVVSRLHPDPPIYGRPARADLRKSFFTVSPIPLPLRPRAAGALPGAPKNMFFVQRFESTVVSNGAPSAAYLIGDGLWELTIAHKDVPLAVAFEQRQRRDLALSLAVEGLMVVALVFLVVGVRRTQRLAEQKMQFVATVSHELRAPVSAISMLSRNQADGLVNGSEKVQQYGELMHQQSRRLNEMVEQTLQYAGIHSNLRRPARTELDLQRLVRETVEARRDDLERMGFQLDVDVPAGLPAVYGDASLLRIAINNLLSNAEKYAGGGRWVGVNVAYSASEKEMLIRVEDRGPGIASADQREVFEPFFRGQAAIDAQIPGSGIGLSLVRSAAEAHRGNVTLVSQPGRGSTFTLHLPV